MAERAEEIGAGLEVVTLPQAGTKVSVIWEMLKEE
jgi:signal transduction histidine kinase